MRKITLLILLILWLIADVAFAVPLTPGLGIAPGPVRQLTTWHSFGGFQLSSTTITIGSSGTWYPVHNATDNLWTAINGDGVTVVNDNLVFANKGDYMGHMTLSISGTSGDDIFVRAFNVTDNVASGYTIGATTTGASNFQGLSIPLHLQANAANKTFRFEVMNNTAGRNVTVRSSVYFIFYLHD